MTDNRVLVNARLDLFGAIEERILAKFIDQLAAIISRIILSRQPGDHIFAVGWCEGQDLDKVQLLAFRQLHQHIVGLHVLCLAVKDLPWPRPHIFFVIKLNRIGHVIGPEDLGLHREEIIRVANMTQQIRRHCTHRLKEIRKDARVGADNRLLLIDDIEGHGTIIGIGHHFDSIANIIEAARYLAIGKAIADDVRILEPIELAIVTDDDIGISVIVEERGHQIGPLHNVAAPEQLTIRVNVTIEQDVEISKIQRKEQAGPHTHVDAGIGRETGGLIAITTGEIKFSFIRAGNDIFAGLFAEVDLRLGDINYPSRWQIFDQKLGQAILRHLGYRRCRHTIAMGIDQLAVYPRLCIDIQLFRG